MSVLLRFAANHKRHEVLETMFVIRTFHLLARFSPTPDLTVTIASWMIRAIPPLCIILKLSVDRGLGLVAEHSIRNEPTDVLMSEPHILL